MKVERERWFLLRDQASLRVTAFHVTGTRPAIAAGFWGMAGEKERGSPLGDAWGSHGG